MQVILFKKNLIYMFIFNDYNEKKNCSFIFYHYHDLIYNYFFSYIKAIYIYWMKCGNFMQRVCGWNSYAIFLACKKMLTREKPKHIYIAQMYITIFLQVTLLVLITPHAYIHKRTLFHVNYIRRFIYILPTYFQVQKKPKRKRRILCWWQHKVTLRVYLSFN